MLGKLLKYDFRSVSREYMLLWPAALVIALVMRFSIFARLDTVDNNLLANITNVLTVFLYVAVLVAMFIITLLFIIQRFYKGILGSEGYLMNTLPVRPWQLVTSKLICAMVLLLVSMAVAGLSVFLMIPISLQDIIQVDFSMLWDRLMEVFPSFLLLVAELVLCSLVALFVILMYICVPFGACFNTWGYDFTLTTKWFVRVFEKYKGLQAFRDSFLLSLASAPITALLSMIISYLVVKRNFKAKGFIEFVSMLAMAVPGTVLGVGYIRGFVNGVFGTGFLAGIYGSAAILIIVFIVRSLPTGTRSGISALRQIDKSIEESAYDMGANSFQVFMTVTLPLIKDSFLSGLVTAFVRSITAISAIILLVTPQFLLITVQINEFAEKGSYGIAGAFATILIAITYGSVLLMNLVIRYFGTSRKLKEVE